MILIKLKTALKLQVSDFVVLMAVIYKTHYITTIFKYAGNAEQVFFIVS